MLRVARVLAALLLTAAPVAAASAPSRHFRVPDALRPQVEFWKKVFATYSSSQIVIHDTEHLDRIYSVLDVWSLVADGEDPVYVDALLRDAETDEKERIRALLVRLHQGDPPASAEEERIVALFQNDGDPQKYLAAADRLRGQKGLRERFAAGIAVGHRYFPEMEAIFAEEGLPRELTRLPLIESCFNIRAYSKVGAAGIWQFMPSTGRRFMRVEDAIDERRDPIKSTRAAARYLRENYEILGTWPLAITAYNHGPAGIARAVDEVGTTDIVDIIRYYRGPYFKFASRNFYPEFLAALEIERDHQRHFGRLVFQEPIPTESVYLSHSMDIRTAATYADTHPDVLADLNPSLAPAVESGRRSIPAGFALQVPAGSSSRFERYAAAWAEAQEAEARRYAAKRATKRQVASRRGRSKSQQVAKGTRSSSKRVAKSKGTRSAKPKHVVHRVRRGQTVDSIARRYGSSVQRILRHNGIRKASRIREGQLLRIPAS